VEEAVLETSELLDLLVRAASSGNWYFLVAAALVAVTWAARKYLSPRWAFLGSDAGGVLLTFSLAFFGALASALGSGAALSTTLFVAAAKIAFTAMGGYAALRKLAWPLLKRAPLPGNWGAKVNATGAGVEAVKAKPGAGAAGVTGAPEDVP